MKKRDREWGGGGEGKDGFKHMKHPLEGIFSFLSLVLTKLYFSEHGEGNSLRVRGLWRLMPMEYA